MTKIDDKTHASDDLIDLGAVSVETKGNVTQYAPDEIAQHKLTPGLSAD